MPRSPSALACVTLWLACCTAQPTPPWEPSSGRPRPTHVRLGVAGRPQERSLSCESRSACDVLAHYGIGVEEDAFRLGIPASDNPDLGFVGDVDGPGGQLPPAGYGVHAEPVAARLRAVGLPARAYRGVELAWLRDRLARGIPVIVWATGGLAVSPMVRLVDARGRPFVAVPGEHTFVAVGYTPVSIDLLDAATGRTLEVPLHTFDASWATLGRQAVAPDTPPAR